MKTFYTILGSGRVAKHLAHYFQLLELPHNVWSRQTDPAFRQLDERIKDSTHVLLAVSDQSIQTLSKHLPKNKTLVHFSGALTVPDAVAAHPLMTFADTLESLNWYQQIPFAVEESHTLAELLPGLRNPWFNVKNTERAKYHALIAMTGNFSYLLWRACAHELEKSSGLSHHELKPFLQQVLDNFDRDPENSLTGPLARNDWATVDRHLHALHDEPILKKLYLDFIQLFKEEAL